MGYAIDRRKFPRFAVSAAYTPIAVRLMDDTEFRFEGHAYDIGEGGIQFELDQGIATGTPVAIQITLPRAPVLSGEGTADGRIFLFGNIVWLDESEPGPSRMALTVTRFASTADRDRLVRHLSSGRFLRAA